MTEDNIVILLEQHSDESRDDLAVWLDNFLSELLPDAPQDLWKPISLGCQADLQDRRFVEFCSPTGSVFAYLLQAAEAGIPRSLLLKAGEDLSIISDGVTNAVDSIEVKWEFEQ